MTTDQEWHSDGVGGDLSTNLDIDTAVVCCLSNPVNRPQERRVEGGEILPDKVITPVDGQIELGEVVAADTQEIDFLGKERDEFHGRRHLDHHSDLRIFKMRELLFQ